MKARLLILWILCLLLSVGARAQFGSDLGPDAISTLAWDQISSFYNDYDRNGTIGLTKDKRMYTWSRNYYYTIHAKSAIEPTNIASGPQLQLAPYYVPSPAGETINKVGVITANPSSMPPTYFALSESGKMYAWGVNTGLLKNQWPIFVQTSVTDTTQAKRTPQLLTVLPEASFVDFAASKIGGNYWVAVSATGKAYYMGRSSGTFSGNFTALSNPTGVDAATFKYTRVWVSDNIGAGAPMIYLKGNNGKIYYFGGYANGYATGVPNIANYADINISYPGRTWSVSGNESIGNVLSILPIEVPIPAGEDIVEMKIGSTQHSTGNIYAISASGKGYIAGKWRTVNRSTPNSYINHTVAPLASVPPVADLIKKYFSGTNDTIYVLNRLTQIATPPGATKMLDVSFFKGDENNTTLAVFDNSRAYWSGITNNSSYGDALFAGNYLSIEQTYLSLVEECKDIGHVTSNSFYSWKYEAINYRGASKLERVHTGLDPHIFIISKTGRGYFVGKIGPHAGIGKQASSSVGDIIYYPTPIANEQLLSCQTSPGTGGPLTAGPVTPTNTAVGTIDCSKTKLYPAPVAGVPSQVSLIVTVNVTTIGDFTPITVSGSGMSLPSDFSTVSATTTGVQTFHIPLNYDGTALTNAFQFTVGSAGSCTADLTQKSNPVITNVWNLTNCSAITPGVLSK